MLLSVIMKLWHALPPEYRVGTEPTQLTTVYRGDKVGRNIVGMTCSLDDGSAEEVVIAAANEGEARLHSLLNRHTSDSGLDSPFISVTTDLRLAQLFARRPDETIYEITLPVDHLVANPRRIGARHKPVETEAFVVGQIVPADIEAVKVNNSEPQASELIYSKNGMSLIHDSLSYIVTTDAMPIEPNPLGVWDRSKSWAVRD